MTARWFHPRNVLICLAVHFGTLVTLICLERYKWIPYNPLAKWSVRNGALIVAFTVAGILFTAAAREYKDTRWLRYAWLSLAANAWLAVVRTLTESVMAMRKISTSKWGRNLPDLIENIFKQSDTSFLSTLHQASILSGNTFLLMGLLAMWWAYHKTGLGFRLERRDYPIMVIVFGIMATIFAFRGQLATAKHPNIFIWYVEQLSLFILALVTVLSVTLHRFSMQMGGGKLATSLRCIIIYALTRNILVALGLFPGMFKVLAIGPVSIAILWSVIAWFATLAASHRAQLTASAARDLAHWQSVRANYNERIATVIPQINAQRG